MAPSEVSYRRLDARELGRVAEIDRSEGIDAIYVQREGELDVVDGDFSSPPWDPRGDGEHSVAGVRRALEAWSSAGGVALGAFDGERLVGLAVVVPRLRPGVAQLAFLYVTADRRSHGIGLRLVSELESFATNEGASKMVVSATPSRNTVDFYRGRGYVPAAEPLPELLELEPEDVHMEKTL